MKLPDSISQKILNRNKINDLFTDQFRATNKIVFTNGCFDILHRGHIYLLNSAKDKGNILVVGLNSDKSVRILKGNKRPIKDEITRTEILASLNMVDYVILFQEETPIELIRQLRPDVLVKGGDYSIRDIVGHDFVTSYGGTVSTVPFLEGYSSSSLIDKMGNE